MNYNPDIHRRRSIRLRGYDYSQTGMYFVTICTQDRRCLFGAIVDGKMQLNSIGYIVHEQWNAIKQRFPMVELDEYVVMPNHIHGLFAIALPHTGTQSETTAVNDQSRATARVAPTVGGIVGAYKSLCVHHCLRWIQGNAPQRRLGKLWQRNYWEHIVRNESELQTIREYICNNPARWEFDKLNPGS